MAGVGVWLGGYLSGLEGGEIRLLLASIAAALVCGAGNALNDYLDIEVDRVNHPGRVLPSGQLEPYYAIIAMIVLNIAAITLGAMVNIWCLIVVLGAMVLLAVYNIKLKKAPVWGNLTVSLLSGATFAAGAVVDRPESIFEVPGPAVPAVFAFMFHFGRELIKDVADYRGDKLAQYSTLPGVISPKGVLAMLIANYTILMALTIIPILLNWYFSVYSYLVILTVDVPLIATMIYLVVAQGDKRYFNAGQALKVLMIFGLVAFLLGKR